MEAKLTIITLAIGLVLLIVGLLFKTFPPRKINSIYGYRTATSRRNLDTWTVANKYSAGLLTLEGLVLTAIGLLTLLLPDSGAIGTAIGFGLFISSIIILAVATEKHLNKLFDKDGNRKTT